MLPPSFADEPVPVDNMALIKPQNEQAPLLAGRRRIRYVAGRDVEKGRVEVKPLRYCEWAGASRLG